MVTIRMHMPNSKKELPIAYSNSKKVVLYLFIIIKDSRMPGGNDLFVMSISITLIISVFRKYNITIL
jgi:hypothetical protein